MTEKPILFSGPMVKAILEGRKSMTRRVLKPQPNMMNGGKPMNDGRGSYSVEGGWKRLPYAPGDVLWARETWWHFDPHGVLYTDTKPSYRADGEIDFEKGDRWRSPRFMPRWASRITLRVTAVKVERLQDISEDDARAEGISPLPSGRYYCDHDEDGEITAKSPVTAFAWLWNSIHGEDAWMANPWIAAYSFERVTP